jgi:hypothetical protein
MSAVSTSEALEDAIRAAAPVVALPVDADPAATAAARASLDASGLLVVGEVHGVAETPALLVTLLRVLDCDALALEWLPQWGGPLAALEDDLGFWSGDGRVTAGHLALVRNLGGVRLVCFDAPGPGRDLAMARRVLAGAPQSGRALVVAGNAHTPLTGPTMGAAVARARAGVRELRVAYRGGAFENFGVRRFHGVPGRGAHLRLRGPDPLVLHLSRADPAIVPRRSTVA